MTGTIVVLYLVGGITLVVGTSMVLLEIRSSRAALRRLNAPPEIGVDWSGLEDTDLGYPEWSAFHRRLPDVVGGMLTGNLRQRVTGVALLLIGTVLMTAGSVLSVVAL